MATTNHNKIKLREVNRHLVCRLCRGYYVDATTIAECLHSFCRSCIIKYLEKNSFCPICEVQIHKTKPYLSLRLDKALQDVVYKVVPGLYHNEMRRRREFYSVQKERLPCTTPEQCGLEERIIFSPEDSISLSLEYLDSDCLESETVSSKSSESGDASDSFALSQHLNLMLKPNDMGSRRETQDTQEPSAYPKRYLQCPAIVNVGHLKKFVRMKHELNSNALVDIIHKRVPLLDHYTLMDVAYIYTWKRSAPLRLFYQIYKTKKQKIVIQTPLSEEKNTEPVNDIKKEKCDVIDNLENTNPMNNSSKVIHEATPNPVEKLPAEAQKPTNNLVPLKSQNFCKSELVNKTKEIPKAVTNVNGEVRKEEPTAGKEKTVSPLKIKTGDKMKPSDKVTQEAKSKTEKTCSNISKVQKLSEEEAKENKINERLLLNPVSGQLESVPFEDYSHSNTGRVEEKDKGNIVRKERDGRKGSGSVRKIKLNKNESENLKKEKLNQKRSNELKKVKIKKKDMEILKKDKINEKESASIRKEKSIKKNCENVGKEKEERIESEKTNKGNESEKALESTKIESEQKKVSGILGKEKEQCRESESVQKAESESVKKSIQPNNLNNNSDNLNKEKDPKHNSENSKKEKDAKKEEESEKKSNLDMLKSFRKEKSLTKEAKIELKTSSGNSLTITALPKMEKSTETETSKNLNKSKEDTVYDFDGSSSPEKNDLFSKQLKNTKSKYLMEHRDKWLAKEAAGELMSFQEYREMLLKENNATENVCTRAKRKSVPNLFRISPEENRRNGNKEYIGKLDDVPKEKKICPGIYNIHTKEEEKKTVLPKNNVCSPPRPIKIENKDGEYFIKKDTKEVNGKSQEVEKQKNDDKYKFGQNVVENYTTKIISKKLKTNDSPIDLTKGEANSKERKNGLEISNDKLNKKPSKPEEKSKLNLEPLLKVPQYSNLKNSSASDWPPVNKNLTSNELSQAFMHLKHMDTINQFSSSAVLEQFAKKTGNLDLLYQQKIDFIRRLKRHQQASEDVAPEKRQKCSPPEDKKRPQASDAKDKRQTSEEIAALKNAEDLKKLSRIQDLLEIQRAVTQNFKMPPALLQFYSRPRTYPPSISTTLPNSHAQTSSQPTKSPNLSSPSGSLPLGMPNASFLDSQNYGHLLSAAGLHTEMSFHQTFKNYLRRQEENPQLPNLPLLKKLPKLKEDSGKTSDKHQNSKAASAKQEKIDSTPET